MSERDPRIWLFDVIEACRLIARFTDGKTLEDYERDVMLRSAVERQLLIIGEALRRCLEFEPDLGREMPDAKRIVGLRNRLAHGYQSIDDAVLWGVIERHVPPLRRVVEALLAERDR